MPFCNQTNLFPISSNHWSVFHHNSCAFSGMSYKRNYTVFNFINWLATLSIMHLKAIFSSCFIYYFIICYPFVSPLPFLVFLFLFSWLLWIIWKIFSIFFLFISWLLPISLCIFKWLFLVWEYVVNFLPTFTIKNITEALQPYSSYYPVYTLKSPPYIVVNFVFESHAHLNRCKRRKII